MLSYVLPYLESGLDQILIFDKSNTNTNTFFRNSKNANTNTNTFFFTSKSQIQIQLLVFLNSKIQIQILMLAPKIPIEIQILPFQISKLQMKILLGKEERRNEKKKHKYLFFPNFTNN